MGAVYREEVVHALNPEDAWHILLETENMQYGNDPYNGSFNNCRLGRCLKKFDKWNDKTKEDVEKFMMTDEFESELDKRQADYIDCGSEEYYRDKLIKTPNKVPAPKFENIYVLEYKDGWGNFHKIEYKEKPEDEEILKMFYMGKHDICLRKEKKAVTDNKVISYSRDKKIFKSKPKNNFKEMHRYVFVGYCPE